MTSSRIRIFGSLLCLVFLTNSNLSWAQVEPSPAIIGSSVRTNDGQMLEIANVVQTHTTVGQYRVIPVTPVPDTPHVLNYEGTLILRGDVPMLATKVAAGRVAGRIPQVSGVQNNLRVQPWPLISDNDILINVQRALRNDLGLTGRDLFVAVRKGRVVMRGTVAGPEQRRLAEEIASEVAGVTAVYAYLGTEFDLYELRDYQLRQ